MGQTNQPTNLLDRLVKVERAIEAVRKLAGLTSAIIRRGGLTLLDNSFIKMMNSDEAKILYIGPNADGKQTFYLYRDNGSRILQADYFMGQPFFAMRDQNDVILFSDNAVGAGGMARPWLPVPMQQLFRDRSNVTPVPPGGETFGYHVLDNAPISIEQVIWKGNASVLHKFMEVRGTWGPSINLNLATFRLKLNGTTVGTWAPPVITIFTTPKYDVSAWLDQNDVTVEITAQVSGAGATACSLQSVYMRQ